MQLKIYTSKNIASAEECDRQKPMETPVKYDAPANPLGQVDKREQVLHSAYFQAVASTADAMITAGGLYPVPDRQNFECVIDAAIAFTDLLIEKVGERL